MSKVSNHEEKEEETKMEDIKDFEVYMVVDGDLKPGHNKARFYLGFELKEEMREAERQRNQNLTARERRSQNRLTKEQKRERRNRKQ